MENRLELADQQLSIKIISSTVTKQRQIASFVCGFAISRTNIKNDLVDEVLNLIEHGKIFNNVLRSKIQSYCEDLDEIQWDLQDLFDMGKISEEKYIQAFCQARAVNALYYAFDENPQIAALESTYEAIAATDAKNELEKMINTILEK